MHLTDAHPQPWCAASRPDPLRVVTLAPWRAPSPEAGETIAEAGLRELSEETGLELRGSRLVVDTIGLWESVYPHLLSAGDPRRHHLVVYLHVLVPQPAHQILRRLKVGSANALGAHDVTFEAVVVHASLASISR